MKMTAKLLEVPAEILACIADELDVEHYGNFRLANRQIHEYTFPYFAKKFFSRRKFFRGYLSLSTLLSISESRLSPYLETLILSTELLEFDAPGDAPNVSKEAYYKAYADQTCMLASGWDRDTLIDALRNLPNLKGVGVESFDDRSLWNFDENLPNSVIDGGYGLKTLLRSLGYEAGRPPNQASPVTQWVTAVQTLLGAVAKAGAKPKSLSITGKSVNGSYMITDSPGVDDDAFNIPTFLEQTLVPVIEGLEELDLDVYNRMLYPSPEDSSTCRTCHLRRFLGLPKKLQKLRIARVTGGVTALENPEERGGLWTWLGWSPKGKGKAVPDDNDGESEDSNGGGQQLQWETTPTNLRNPLISPAPISLPHLRELHLASEDILSANLARLVNKVAPTLVRLDLHELNLRDRVAEIEAVPGADGSEEPADEVRAEVGLWVAMCGRLAAMPLAELREVNISGFGGLGSWHLSKFGDGVAALPDSVHFRALRIVGEDSFRSRAEFSYKGPNVREALGQLADDLRAAVRDGRHVFVSEPSRRRNSF
ncbi:putative f-box domain-containing protein [Diaporthe ampelina]|uniref:Putative f-box domain-containing protein n=1 Tax=Diaporthe ampelina TaxID=1214573 RepID=A0A0G2HYD1_9PEZI|nr:putative f-box domain-containing protein [Diaporthe ampelina]